MSMAMEEVEFLRVGSTVEVSSVDKGAWYVAKILKSLNKRGDKFLIQYQTLVSEKGPNELLTWSVDFSFIRPLPPPPAPDQTYEVHDVVDAFHRNGWWKGVVCGVEEKNKSKKYIVFFENPPGKFEFCSQNLRFHSVWSDGKWVQPPKRKRMEGLKICKGMEVEVNFNRENLQDAWFPAIVVEEVGFNSFLVEFLRSGNGGEDGRMKETVDSFHIRPTPPNLDVQNFEILERVEAFCDSCWKKGTIVTTLTRGRYKVLVDSEKEDMQFSQSEMRPYLVWRNGKWFGVREIPNRRQSEEQSAHVDDIARHSEAVASVTGSIAAKDRNVEKSYCKRMSAVTAYSKDISSVKKLRHNPSDTNQEIDAFGKKDQGGHQNSSKGTAREMEIEDCASNDTEFPVSMESTVITPSTITVRDHIEKVGGSVDSANGGKEGDGDQSSVKADSDLMKKQEMPFKKTSPLWEHVDSLDVFRSLPQKPHFRPLFDRNEATREGFAMGQMLNFSTLVGKVTNLRADTPRKVFESYLEAFADLELYGFDVKAVVDRINKLLVIKTRREQLNKESEDIRSKIAQCDAEKAAIEEEINAIDEMIRALQTTKAMKLSEKVMKDSEIDLLRLDANRISEDISTMKLAFETRTAAPW